MHITKKEILILCILILIAFVRFFFFLSTPPPYDSVVGKKVNVEGLVVYPSDKRIANQRVVLSPTGHDTNILLVLPNDVAIDYGDKIQAQGILETPDNFLTTSGKEFNYKRYLANQDIYYIIRNPSIEILSHNNGNILKSSLYKLRNSFSKNIGNVINPPESDLAGGLLLGTRGGFDSSMRDEFITTGTIHIVALSGYNVTIVVESVMKVFSLVFSQMISILFGVIFIFLFILMAGATSTSIRAGIMAVIMLLGQMTGRTYYAGRALFITALLMIVYDIRVLTDISFQLSFLATFGVLFITPKVIRYIMYIPSKFKLRETIGTTLAATIAVLPLLLYSTGILSLVSLPANVLILPLIPITMLASFITGMLGFISPILAMPFAYVSHLLLLYILSIINFFATLPFASVTIKSFPLFITLALYILIGYWVIKKENRM